jgi:hypothetical protein
LESGNIRAMRVYKFLDAHFGLKTLYEKRLKISKIDDLNDPFELLPFDLSDRLQRYAAHETRKAMAATQGLLCFSASWRDPVIWAHYSDKHKGICLGFDVPDDVARRVEYVTERFPFPESPTMADSDRMLWTKFDNWAYEQEIRIWAGLDEHEGGIYYKDFDDNLRLMEVIAGAKCSVPEHAFQRALKPFPSVIPVKARAGFKKFEVVLDQRGFPKT